MRLALFASCLIYSACSQSFEVPFTTETPMIDGTPSDAAWELAEWRQIDQLALGNMPSTEDFSGRYKLVWTSDYLYLLAEITDDVLIDSHANPVDQYWEDDILEVFIDEDASGGNHRDNFNAFAYHMTLDNQIVDIAPSNGDVKPRLFPGHVTARWQRSATNNDTTKNPVYWEARIAVHNDTHTYGDDDSSRVNLIAGKTMGFMVAYCDADSTAGREAFLGDVEVEPVNGDRNRAYIDASVFGQITLIKQ